MTILFPFLITLLILAVIAFSLWYFERMFAKKEGKYAGILMPALFLILSIVSIVQSAPATFANLRELGYGIGPSVATLAFSFVLTNVPTLWVYFVYRRTRKKLGLEAWPFRNHSAASDDTETKNVK
ncbi:MAG: hypothetical protein Q4D42_11745 [Eubacteriales bacterium]|nr:hypothetical protein [Eubacteriales bacterium]